ncbi:kinesin-like protein KIF21A [Actinia tenebrosa]|uniref:Kinesin-like protein KIF21A n=1 Tax=Actinia tenebrosa TaxID=6105 RepID=A0A6P8HPD3_ACTTE|nr:kinesin-like protein KIF21A [Actinia tenebrosa]
MADIEVKQKKRKISDVFKKKNKENKKELAEEVEVLDVKETGEKTVEKSGEKDVETADVQDTHERKKKKFGHRRFLPSRNKKSKKEKSEVESSQVVKEENLVMDRDKPGQVEAEEEEFVEEKDNIEPEPEKDNSEEFTSEVQNVQLKCESPEAVIQSDGKEVTAQTMATNVNKNKEQLKNDVLLKEESQSSEEGSVIRALLRQGVPSEETPTDEHHDPDYSSDSTKQGEDEEKCDSNEVERCIREKMTGRKIHWMPETVSTTPVGRPGTPISRPLYSTVLICTA